MSAATLGHAAPRNEVVGAVWYNAHEYVRRHLPTICDCYMSFRDPEQRTDVREVLGLSDLCFAPCGTEATGPAMWQQAFGDLGDCTHAFPRTVNEPPHFDRNLSEPSFICCLSDGDDGMWSGVAKGLGTGTARLNRGGRDQHSDGCVFHSLKGLMKMFDQAIVRATATRDRQGPRNYDKQHPLGCRLGKKPSYHSLFGDIIDEVINHDIEEVVRACWNFALWLATLMGMEVDVGDLKKYHDPETGLSGKVGRAQQTYELAEGDTSNHPLVTLVDGQKRRQRKGTVTTANGVEGNINKRTKQLFGKPQVMAQMISKCQLVLTDVTRETVGRHGFSLLPDFLGQNAAKQHAGKSGRPAKEKTGKTAHADFGHAINFLADNGVRFRAYHYKVKGQGRDAEYIMSSQTTIETVDKMIAYDNLDDTYATKQRIVKGLREVWLDFIREPAEHILCLREDIEGEDGKVGWDVEQARRHLLDGDAFKGAHNKWACTSAQVYRIVQSDLMYHCNAFHRVIPRPEVLPTEEARKHMTEPFRTDRGPWHTDLGFFECLECKTYAVNMYCLHCVLVTLYERLLVGLPLAHDGLGLRQGLHSKTEPVMANRYGRARPQDGRSTSAEKPTPQRYSSQARSRGNNPCPRPLPNYAQQNFISHSPYLDFLRLRASTGHPQASKGGGDRHSYKRGTHHNNPHNKNLLRVVISK